jgi:two-component system, OmpR family, sensor histidine kinase KdpD
MRDELDRPNPDVLLAQLQAEESKQTRGKLKIFLGYAAGVGKTYAMLEAAHQRQGEGVDVVIGYVETHGRKETDALVDGLRGIPRTRIEYHGVDLADMDLDAVLKSNAQLVLVDELAHTNIPGMRHPKRYQDVEEILDAGMDVYTTVNVQHLESLKDIVFQITGVVVHETVPDRVIDEAYEIELVDLPTDELLDRLQDGKVYVSDQATRAIKQFFRKGNLTALRELSMRRAADRVDSQMLNYMKTKSISGPWPAGDRIMVCISSHPLGERLIRTGRRLADDLNAEWSVVFVETPGHLKMPVENQLRIQKSIRLAEELGAKIVQLTGASVAEAVLTYAHQNNITKIVAGKPFRPRWFEVLRGSVIDQIIMESGTIDVYVVSERPANALPGTTKQGWSNFRPHRPYGRYLVSLGLIILFTLIGLPLSKFLDPTNLVMLYLVAVVLAAVFLGRGPAIMASIASVLAFDFFFIDPVLTFTVNDTQYVLTFLGLLIVGTIISGSASLLRDQIDILRQRSQLSQELTAMGRALTAAITLDEVLQTIVKRMNEMFHRETVVLLPENEILMVKVATQGFTLSESEQAVADWAYKNGKEAGCGTSTLPASSVHFIPLVTAKGKVGVFGSKPLNSQRFLTNDERVQLEGALNLAALAIERASFAEKAAQTEMLRNTEKLQSALLNSISHELRTPLAIVTGVITSLEDSENVATPNKMDPGTRLELIRSAGKQAARLNHLVENLLDMTRLESGAMRLNRELIDVEDLLGTVVRQVGKHSEHPIEIIIRDEIPLMMIDGVLVAQVLENLIDNACKYSVAGRPIRISAKIVGSQLELAVRDSGIGIPPADLERVFDKFYRVQRQDKIVGTGLGLSICKGIVEAHQGRIWAQNNQDQGVSIFFTLPLMQES